MSGGPCALSPLLKRAGSGLLPKSHLCFGQSVNLRPGGTSLVDQRRRLPCADQLLKKVATNSRARNSKSSTRGGEGSAGYEIPLWMSLRARLTRLDEPMGLRGGMSAAKNYATMSSLLVEQSFRNDVNGGCRLLFGSLSSQLKLPDITPHPPLLHPVLTCSHSFPHFFTHGLRVILC